MASNYGGKIICTQQLLYQEAKTLSTFQHFFLLPIAFLQTEYLKDHVLYRAVEMGVSSTAIKVLYQNSLNHSFMVDLLIRFAKGKSEVFSVLSVIHRNLQAMFKAFSCIKLYCTVVTESIQRSVRLKRLKIIPSQMPCHDMRKNPSLFEQRAL